MYQLGINRSTGPPSHCPNTSCLLATNGCMAMSVNTRQPQHASTTTSFLQVTDESSPTYTQHTGWMCKEHVKTNERDKQGRDPERRNQLSKDKNTERVCCSGGQIQTQMSC